MDTLRPNSVFRITRPIRREELAFSLIELILVLTIISVLAAIAVPRYANALARYRVDAAASRVVADLDYARQRARASSASVTVSFKTGQECVILEGVQHIDDPGKQWGVALAGKPYYADLVSVDFTGHKLIFDGYGYPDSGGTAVLRVGTETRTVVLDADTGKAAVQ